MLFFKSLSLRLHGDNEENHTKTQVIITDKPAEFKPDMSGIQVWSITIATYHKKNTTAD
jgi:hypothetical protein